MNYFSNYIEYTARTILAEEELREALKSQCTPWTSANWKASLDNALNGPDGEIQFRLPKCFSSGNPKEIILVPDGPGLRHFMRGLLHITLSKASDSADTLLHIAIRPDETPLVFLLVWIAIAAAMIVHAIRSQDIPMLLAGCGLTVFMVALLHGCHTLGKRKIPQIQDAFGALLKKLEFEHTHLASPVQQTRG